MIHNKIWW